MRGAGSSPRVEAPPRDDADMGVVQQPVAGHFADAAGAEGLLQRCVQRVGGHLVCRGLLELDEGQA